MASAITKASGLFSDFWRSDFMSEVNEAQWTMLTKDEKIMLVLVAKKSSRDFCMNKTTSVSETTLGLTRISMELYDWNMMIFSDGFCFFVKPGI